MRKLFTGLVTALVLTALAATADYLFFAGEPFGLWAYTLTALGAMVIALVGILMVLLRFFTGRSNLATAGMLMLTGALTFVAGWLVWLAAGMPAPL